MKPFRSFVGGYGVILMLGLIVSCQNNPLAPSEQSAVSFRYVKATPISMGLAKSGLSTDTLITVEQGGTLEIDGNYIQIPAGALDQDMVMTFSITTSEDSVLQFTVEGEAIPEGEHIYFNDGKLSTIGVKEEWLSEAPDIGINVETNEEYGVQFENGYYTFRVPHFTLYNWGLFE